MTDGMHEPYRPELKKPLGQLMMPFIRLIKAACPGIELTAELMPTAPGRAEGVLVGLSDDAFYVTVDGWRLRIGVEVGSVAPAGPDVIGKLLRVKWESES